MKIYRRQIKSWHNHLKNKVPSSYFKTFLQNIEKDFKFQVTFDSNLPNIISKMLESQAFWEYGGKKYQNKNKNLLFQIIHELYLKKFINKRHFQYLEKYKSQNFRHKIILFLQITSGQFFDDIYLEEAWNSVFQISLQQFWHYMIKHNIYEIQIIRLYQKIINIKSLCEIKGIQQYIANIKKQIPENCQNLLNLSISIISHQQLNSTEDNSKLSFFQRYSIDITDPQEDIDKVLHHQFIKYSLFQNIQYQNNLKKCYHLKNQINHLLQKGNSNIQYCQIYGSLRNRIALITDYDLDLAVIMKNSNKLTKIQQADILKNIQVLMKQKKLIDIKIAIVHNFPKLRIPFLKIQIDNLSDNKWNIKNLKKIDFTIAKSSSLLNSKMLQKLTQNKQILAFCVLIKLWAKIKGVINATSPMNGLSSYGVILMAIYYLMFTNQVSFIKYQTDIQNIDNSSSLKSLYTNLLGFFQFYQENGEFFKKKLIICLDKSLDTSKHFDEDIIYNMYDFFDSSNPGRLTKQKQNLIFPKIKNAITSLKSQRILQIISLFEPTQQ